MRLTEIDNRLREIRALLENPNDTTDVDALTKEVNDLLEERKAITDAANRRRSLLDAIAGANLAPLTPLTPIDNGAHADDNEDERGALATPEYRRAFFRSLMGRPLTQADRDALDTASEERAAMTSSPDSAGIAIPTETQNSILRKMVQIAPMLNEITLFHIPGNLSMLVESVSDDAEAHTEGAEANDANDKLVAVNMGGYEVIKTLSISAKVRVMTISAFETWLVDTLADGCARKIENWIINGTGSDQPTGIEKAAAEWGDNNSVKIAGDTMTFAEICKVISLLPGAYDSNAKFLMNKKTFWQKIMPIRDDGKAPIVRDDRNGSYAIMGYPVLLSSKVADDTLYLGDYKRYIGNMADDIAVASSIHSSFRKNMVDYRSTCIFDGKPADADAFVKAYKAGE